MLVLKIGVESRHIWLVQICLYPYKHDKVGHGYFLDRWPSKGFGISAWRYSDHTFMCKVGPTFTSLVDVVYTGQGLSWYRALAVVLGIYLDLVLMP